MIVSRNKSLKTNSYNDLTQEEVRTLLVLNQEIQRKSGTAELAANDTLYDELEARYGGGFAQWITDRISMAIAREKGE